MQVAARPAPYLQRNFLRPKFVTLAAFACVLLLSSCKTASDAAAAAKQLTGTAHDLSTYYQDLSKQMDDTIVLNEMQQAVFGVPLGDSDRTELLDIKKEIGKRAAMADSLSKLASAYGDLAGSKASSDAATAASKLGTELTSCKAFPKGSPLPDIMSEAAKLVVEFAETQQLKTGAKAIQQTVSAVDQLFDREKPYYESLAKTRIVLAQSLAKRLVDQDQVDLNAVIQPALKPFNLAPKLRSGAVPPEYKTLAGTEIDEQATEQIAASVDAADDISKSLRQVDEKLQEVVTGKKAASPPKQ